METREDVEQDLSPAGRLGWAVVFLVLANLIVVLSASMFGDDRVIAVAIFVTLVSVALVLLNAGLRR